MEMVIIILFIIPETASNQGFGPQQIIDTNMFFSTAIGESLIVSQDLDGDGDADLISGPDKDANLVWFMSDGNGNFSGPGKLAWYENLVISTAISETYTIPSALFPNPGDKVIKILL
jgi:hypothetical protein